MEKFSNIRAISEYFQIPLATPTKAQQTFLTARVTFFH